MRFRVIAQVRFTVEVSDSDNEDAVSDAVYEAALELLPMGVELDDCDYTEIES